jgi:C-terminal processing protease CtpA/Prc
MKQTPIGKTVDIEYIRDGENKKTQLTTISEQESERLSEVFAERPEGRGRFGYEDRRAERVQIPGTNIYGVKLNEIESSRPADLAGIKEGDIIIEFDKIPIRTRGELLMRVRRALPYQIIDVVVMRGEADKLEKIVIPVKMGRQ